ncbi:hypothetical protein [Acetobacter estunensis]|uniref:hypothetical protein n=1 Tax=Acetobacter estunensis TaxID=104097 RepID=UPI001C2DA5E4|nr:hypothetical protein [Acetobacter estunensis]MBV1835718.1 hypothetical protein [Acetobacter estunensis]MBV1836021.1 hypothetical protein [Acetobacter estunensis]
MVTPAIQGGYHTWTREKFEAYHQFMVGVKLHLDYAVTDDLVLRGRLGWAELLGSEMQAPYATFHQADRPLWEGGLDLDYRLTRQIHLIGGALYTHSSLGRSRFSPRDGGRNSMYIASSWTNGLTLHLGAVYAF